MLAAADEGDPKAQMQVGLSYYFGANVTDGSLVPKNHSAALAWLSRAAATGDAYAQFHLGGMYNEGIGVEPDDTMAAQYFLASARAGHAAARVNIAIFYFEGKGVVRDYREAYAWASLASYQGKGGAAAIVQKVIPLLEDRESADNLAGLYFKRYGVRDPYPQ